LSSGGKGKKKGRAQRLPVTVELNGKKKRKGGEAESDVEGEVKLGEVSTQIDARLQKLW
jgi:hypothetical protein